MRQAVHARRSQARLMLHFLRRLMPSAEQEPQVAPSAELVLPWLAIALASIAVSWALYPEIANRSLHDVLASNALWKALGPVLIGARVAFKMQRLEHRLAGIPAGDVLAGASSPHVRLAIWVPPWNASTGICANGQW